MSSSEILLQTSFSEGKVDKYSREVKKIQVCLLLNFRFYFSVQLPRMDFLRKGTPASLQHVYLLILHEVLNTNL